MKQVLVVVDYQNDFVTGALANPAAQALEPVSYTHLDVDKRQP